MTREHRMRHARRLLAVCLLPLSLPAATQRSRSKPTRTRLGSSCRRVVVELQAAAGESVRRGVTNHLDLLLEALPSGWVLRVVPHNSPAPAIDWAAIASPPYRSVSPLLLSTDFAFRSQDAVGWNPRRFHVAAGPAMYRRLEAVYRSIARTNRPSPADEAELGRLLRDAPEGTLLILDARLVPGTGDLSRAAASVSSRLSDTAHTDEPPPPGMPSTSLGSLRAVSLRVSLDLPAGEAAAPNARVQPAPCADP